MSNSLWLWYSTDGKAVGRPQPMQLVLLGTGDAWMEAALHGLAMSYPGWAVGVAEFQVPEQDCRFWAPFALHYRVWAGDLRSCAASMCECNQRTHLALLLARFKVIALIMTCALFRPTSCWPDAAGVYRTSASGGSGLRARPLALRAMWARGPGCASLWRCADCHGCGRAAGPGDTGGMIRSHASQR